MFVVSVSINVKEKHTEAFLEHVIANAISSMREEDGCLQFDVCRSNDHDNLIYLYEIYTNEDSFDLHLKSNHFLKFEASTGYMILQKTVKNYYKIN